VLDSTITLFKASFRHCWPAALLYSIANLVLTVWIQQRLANSALAPGATFSEIMAEISSPGIWAGYLLMVLLSMFINLAMASTILEIARGRGGRSALAHFGTTLPLLPGAVGLALALFFGMLVIGVVAAMLAAMLGMRAGEANIAGAATGITIMLVVILFPCVYVLVRWALWSAAYTDRREGAFAALGTSWNLVDGNWWRTLVTLSVVGIIVMILVALLGAVAGYATAAGGEDSFAAILLSATLQGALEVLYLPAIAACLVATYMDLQLRKGGADLAARLGSLSGTQA
jgi:hypothetical protein